MDHPNEPTRLCKDCVDPSLSSWPAPGPSPSGRPVFEPSLDDLGAEPSKNAGQLQNNLKYPRKI